MDYSEGKAIRSYLRLMVEFRNRHELVDAACAGKLRLTRPYAREFCYFQFRRMCELIALGCLMLHGDLPETQSNNAKDIWNAHRVMALLGKLNPHFFPSSVSYSFEDGKHNIQANSIPDALSLSEFKRLYAECGEVLHTGTIRSLELDTEPTNECYTRLLNWHHNIMSLMNMHIIERSPRSRQAGFYLMTLRSETGAPGCSNVIIDPTDSSRVHVSSVVVNLTPQEDLASAPIAPDV